jgi:hypothetical protein
MNITEDECRQLVITKRCGENKMNCVKDDKETTYCEFTPTLNQQFEWLSTHYEEGVQCKVKSLPIAQHGDKHTKYMKHVK